MGESVWAYEIKYAVIVIWEETWVSLTLFCRILFDLNNFLFILHTNQFLLPPPVSASLFSHLPPSSFTFLSPFREVQQSTSLREKTAQISGVSIITCRIHSEAGGTSFIKLGLCPHRFCFSHQEFSICFSSYCGHSQFCPLWTIAVAGLWMGWWKLKEQPLPGKKRCHLHV